MQGFRVGNQGRVIGILPRAQQLLNKNDHQLNEQPKILNSSITFLESNGCVLVVELQLGKALHEFC